ncbi:hypothetical protein BDR05DRAFT_974182 [Suillus weaverae]|nr:hypothetical protein BDR05DRAFT_974182 [Suillus weaverae]
MVSVLSNLVSVFAAICGVLSMPFMNTTTSARATPAAPHFVIYSDKWVSSEIGPPDVSSIAGYNVLRVLHNIIFFSALSFWLVSALLDDTTRTSLKASYQNAGISLIVSAFGSTDVPTTLRLSLIVLQTMYWNMISTVCHNVDYEDLYAMDAENGSAEIWLTTFTIALRAKLPQGMFSTQYASGVYLMVHQNVASLIDWYNIQEKYTTEGTFEYTTCSGLLTASSPMQPNTALFQIAAAGIPWSAFMFLLAGFPDADSTWITAVRTLAFP